MGLNIRDILKKQSIIQLTLLKVIFSILAFLIIFILFYGQNFWEKQAIKFNYDLLLSISSVQMRVQSQISTIEELKKDKNLSKNDRILKVDGIIQSIINRNINNDYIIGH
ncbi:hypothetical protein [Desulfosporosinus sp. I2]|uniref:hypothetical protein n=1 Tax=Desulfosporosinus sp. I2 TaxID=1617025 RepID=UPI0005EFAA2C|nr:hypothetical protein [Desulfosporosinus sp. I2]